MRIRDITIRSLLVIIATTQLNGGVLHGQNSQQTRTIHATGQHALKVAPQKLRLTLTLQAEGTDAKSAVRKLAEHKDRVRQELIALKAEEATIEFGATQVATGVGGLPSDMQSYGARMMARIAQELPGSSAEGLPQIATATATVQADWPLPTTDLDALALLPSALEDQVKARDLRGEKNKADLDASQQERLEEMQTKMEEEMGYYGGNDEATPFGILFVAKVNDEQRQTALKAAYDQAVARAKMLANVSGHKLGELTALRSSGESATADWSSAYATAYGIASGSLAIEPVADEVTAASPDQLKLYVGVEAEFGLTK